MITIYLKNKIKLNLKISTKAMLLFMAFFIIFISKMAWGNDFNKNNIPTYQEFLNLFPNGYTGFDSNVGNPKSMGAYELYLRELGFSTNQRQGNNVGFQIFIESRSDFEATDDENGNKTSGDFYATSQQEKAIEIHAEKFSSLEKSYSEYEIKNNLSVWGHILQTYIKNNLVYPIKAVKRKETGKVIVSISVSPKGNILQSKIILSSGYNSLDQSVLKTINSIDNLPKISKLEEDKVYKFTLPINFSL